MSKTLRKENRKSVPKLVKKESKIKQLPKKCGKNSKEKT